MVLLFVEGLSGAIFLATLSYVFVEKPAIDARRVFKNKWEKEKIQ